MNDRVITLHPGEKLVIHQTPPTTRHLTPNEWAVLITAESRIFKGESGYVSYTDVIERTEETLAAQLWDHVYNQLDVSGDFETETGHPMVTDQMNRMVASRVARALALAVFGPEFLLK